MYATLTPAYGRDYKNKAAVEADLRAEKDFILQTPWQSALINLPQLRQAGYTHANVRYARLTKVTVIRL